MNIEENKTKLIQAIIDARNTIVYESESGADDPRVDHMKDEIIKLISENRDELAVDFMVEAYTHIGAAPCMAYDDNGFFAFVEPSMGPVNLEPEDFEIVLYVEKKMWKKNMREAFYNYLDRDNDED